MQLLVVRKFMQDVSLMALLKNIFPFPKNMKNLAKSEQKLIIDFIKDRFLKEIKRRVTEADLKEICVSLKQMFWIEINSEIMMEPAFYNTMQAVYDYCYEHTLALDKIYCDNNKALIFKLLNLNMFDNSYQNIKKNIWTFFVSDVLLAFYNQPIEKNKPRWFIEYFKTRCLFFLELHYNHENLAEFGLNLEKDYKNTCESIEHEMTCHLHKKEAEEMLFFSPEHLKIELNNE